MNVRTIGIDLGKTVSHLVGLDEPGNVVVKRRLCLPQIPNCLEDEICVS
jgi:hypothetical protein